MKEQAQEQLERKQRFESKGSRPTQSPASDHATLEVEVAQQKDQETGASVDTQFDAMPDMDHTRVAELAYGLYEERGRRDGYDREDWFNAKQQLMT